MYKAREVELIMLVKRLLYTEKFTIDGARQQLDHFRRTGELKGAARQAVRQEMVRDVRELLGDIIAVLDGKEPVARKEPEPAEVAPAEPPEPPDDSDTPLLAL